MKIGSLFENVHRRNYIISSLPVVGEILSQPVVKGAGCLVFALAQFLNNRKSFGGGGRMEDLLPVSI